MRKSILLSIKITMVMLGSIVGAGFATGKEIVNFFGIYGKFAPEIIVVTGILFFLAMMCFFMSGKYPENHIISYFFNCLIFISEFILLVAMISGLFCVTNIFLSNDILVYFLLVISFFIGILGVKGLESSNLILAPILIISVISVCIVSLVNNTSELFQVNNSTTIQKLSYPFLYFGLNLFTSFPICKELGKKMTRKEIIITSTLTSFLITICISLISISVMKSSDMIFNSDMPLAILACNINGTIGFIFFFVILIGIMTTLVSCLFVLNSYHKNFKANKSIFAFFTIIIAYLFNFIGFSKIIQIFYPLIGIFGVALFIVTEITNKKGQRLLCPIQKNSILNKNLIKNT